MPCSPELCCQVWTPLDGQTQKVKSSGSRHESSWTSPLGYSCSQSRRAEYTGEKLIAVDREGQREWLCTFLGHWSASTGHARSTHGSASPAASELMKRGIQGPNCVFQGKLEADNKEVWGKWQVDKPVISPLQLLHKEYNQCGMIYSKEKNRTINFFEICML